MQPNLVNGWREVLARIFEGFGAELNVSPEWLVNPDTNRKLKLDYLYGDINVAIRFVGLEGREQKRRKSDQEAEQEVAQSPARAVQPGSLVLSSLTQAGAESPPTTRWISMGQRVCFAKRRAS